MTIKVTHKQFNFLDAAGNRSHRVDLDIIKQVERGKKGGKVLESGLKNSQFPVSTYFHISLCSKLES